MHRSSCPICAQGITTHTIYLVNEYQLDDSIGFGCAYPWIVRCIAGGVQNKTIVLFFVFSSLKLSPDTISETGGD